MPFPVLLGVIGVADCALPAKPSGGGQKLVYVLSARDRSVRRIDGASGRAVGAPLPAGPGPYDLAVGPTGSVLVLSNGLSKVSQEGRALTFILTFVQPPAGRPKGQSPSGAGASLASVIPLEPEQRVSPGGTRVVSATGLLASDGGAHAVAVYDVYTGQARVRRLALIDLRSGAVLRTHTINRSPDDYVYGLTLDDRSAAPVAYLAWWNPQRPAGAVLAVNARSGAPVGQYPLRGAPASLTLGPVPGEVASEGAGSRWVYCVEAVPGPTNDPDAGPHAEAIGWQLLGLQPTTLALQQQVPLREAPLRLTVPDAGGSAYAVLTRDGRVASRIVLRIELATGVATHLATLPAAARGLAVAADRLYTLDPEGGWLWAVDRRRGRVEQSTQVGRWPVSLVLGPSGESL
jgi:hypothetical protein